MTLWHGAHCINEILPVTQLSRQSVQSTKIRRKNTKQQNTSLIRKIWIKFEERLYEPEI
jgi:hypothetical protein